MDVRFVRTDSVYRYQERAKRSELTEEITCRFALKLARGMLREQYRVDSSLPLGFHVTQDSSTYDQEANGVWVRRDLGRSVGDGIRMESRGTISKGEPFRSDRRDILSAELGLFDSFDFREFPETIWVQADLLAAADCEETSSDGCFRITLPPASGSDKRVFLVDPKKGYMVVSVEILDSADRILRKAEVVETDVRGGVVFPKTITGFSCLYDALGERQLTMRREIQIRGFSAPADIAVKEFVVDFAGSAVTDRMANVRIDSLREVAADLGLDRALSCPSSAIRHSQISKEVQTSRGDKANATSVTASISAALKSAEKGGVSSAASARARTAKEVARSSTIAAVIVLLGLGSITLLAVRNDKRTRGGANTQKLNQKSR